MNFLIYEYNIALFDVGVITKKKQLGVAVM